MPSFARRHFAQRQLGALFYARAAALWLLGAAACTAGHAQVHRCTDAQGHVTYTNAPCASGEAAVLVQPALNPQEREQQQAQYEQALQRRDADRAAQAQKDAAAQAEQVHANNLRASQAAQAAAERAAKAEAAAQAAADAAARAPVPTVLPAWGGHGPRPAPPPHIHRPRPPAHHPQPPHGGPAGSAGQSGSGWSCNVFRCTDGRGNTRPVP